MEILGFKNLEANLLLMSHPRGYDWRILDLAPRGRSYVEVGSGYGVWGLELKARDIATEITAIEPFKPYADKLAKFGIYDQVINKNLLEIPEGSIKRDVALVCDVIEHINRDDADRFLSILESIADMIILSTPNGNKANDLELDGNPLNRHRSYYDEAYFIDRGYRTEIVDHYPRPPRILRPLEDLYWRIRGGRNVTSQIIAVKGYVLNGLKES